MSQTQKIIKNCAVALALLLTISIFSGLFGSVLVVGSLFGDSENSITYGDVLKVNDNVSKLAVELNSVKFIIRQDGYDFEITKSDYINVKTTSYGIYITEKSRRLFENRDEIVVLTVPEGFLFDNVSIETGAGKLEIDGLETNVLDLELGAGKIKIDNLEVFDEADIEGGAGAIEIKNSKFNDLNLDLGVGNFDFDGVLYGDNEINAGVGTINMLIDGDVEDYSVNVSKGLGKVTVGDEVAKNGDSFGTGVNKISIDGGIGEIDVDFTIMGMDTAYENNNI